MKTQRLKIFRNVLCMLLCASCHLSLAEIPTTDYLVPPFDDWEQSDDPKHLCLGYYVPATLPSVDPNDPTITISSDSGGIHHEQSHFKGNVHLQQGCREMTADHMTMIRQNNQLHTLQASGHITITEPGLRLDATDAAIAAQTNVVDLKNAHFRLYDRHARGQAPSLQATGSDHAVIKNAS